MPEINDEDAELLKLTKRVLGGKSRKSFLRLAKEADPELPVPELEMEESTLAMLKPIQEENKKLRDDLAARDSRDNVREVRRLLKEKHQATDEEITAAEKIMLERKIGDHVTALEFYRANQQLATPTPTDHSWDTSATVPQDKELAADPNQWARKAAGAVIDEIRGKKKR